jgi:hypothetical protein
MVEQNTNSPSEKPQAVAVKMLNEVYDSLEEKDLSRTEFVNEALDIMGKTKAQPKSRLILPEGN